MTDAGANNADLFDQVHAFAIASSADALTDAEVATFEQLLNDNAEARRIYLEYIQASVFIPRILAALETPGLLRPSSPSPLMGEGRGEGSSVPPAPTVKSPVLGFLGGVVDYVSHSRTLMFALIGGSLGLYFAVQLGSLMVSRFWAQNAVQLADDRGAGTAKHDQGRENPEIAGKIVARLTNAVDCRWEVVATGQPPPRPSPTRGEGAEAIAREVGAEFHAGQKLNLTAGLAELTFDSGAKVILHAPARFDVTDALGGDLERGKLTAKVPHTAAGFTIATPGGKVVDLGTEFGVKVRDDGVMNVIVYVGDVQIESGAGGTGAGGPDQPKVVHLHAGQAITVGPGVVAKRIPPENERFVRDLAPLGDPAKAEAAYVEFMKSLKPVVWCRMEGKETDRVLHDEMGGPDAKLVWDGPGNPYVKGVIGKSLWLRGVQLKDYAIVKDYPKAEHGKLSVAAWTYAESFPQYATIVGNWKEMTAAGQFYFGITTSNNLQVMVTSKSGAVAAATEPAAHPMALYEWQHVAFTTDGETLRLYRQGREVAAVKHSGLAFPMPTKALGIGACFDSSGETLGKSYPGLWDGKLDEIAIFNDTLSADDIRKLAGAAPR